MTDEKEDIMGLFGFGKKSVKSELQIKAESLPRLKKVQFTHIKRDEAEALLDKDVKNILTFEPVNYYADKCIFLQCNLHFKDDYSEIYLNLTLFVNDVEKESTKFYQIDKDIMRAILRKFGQNI